ncbi:MAG: hypothetical protein JWO99_230 [Candidatus Saccharibacteria bacterium]|nr:hypothetical protein [Candidatus Saccharibacteria bacterium]
MPRRGVPEATGPAVAELLGQAGHDRRGSGDVFRPLSWRETDLRRKPYRQGAGLHCESEECLHRHPRRHRRFRDHPGRGSDSVHGILFLTRVGRGGSTSRPTH